jgi:phospholipid/cholesterol/gamma-HCH transport system ATP-binding protein
MVFQSGALFDALTVWENVAFPMREVGKLGEEQISRRVDELLEMVGVTHIRDLYPSDISTGIKRSVAVARALAANPRAVLYDEPTTMVDPLMARRLGNLIGNLKLHLKLTSVVVTHDMCLVEKLADHVVFLDRGRVIFYGTLAEMERSSERIVRQFLELDLIDMRAGLNIIKACKARKG